MSRRSSRTAARAAAVQSALDVSGVTSVTLVLEEQYQLAVGALSGYDLGGSDVSGQPAGRTIRLLVDADGSVHVPRAPTDFHLYKQGGPSPYTRRQIGGSEGEAHVWHLRRVRLLRDLPRAESFVYIFFLATGGFAAGWYRAKRVL